MRQESDEEISPEDEEVRGRDEGEEEGGIAREEASEEEAREGGDPEGDQEAQEEQVLSPEEGLQEESREEGQQETEDEARDPGRLKAIIESLVFASSGLITLNALCRVLVDEERAVVRAALAELIGDYRRKEGGFYIEEVAGGFEFRTRPEFSTWVKALLRATPRRLSRAALETLAMVAYRQPITRGEIEAIRGVDSGGVLSTLMERRLVKISGRKNTPGRPAVYSTTREFLEVFDLKDLSSLPSLKEIEAPEEDYEQNEAEQIPLLEEGSERPAPGTVEAVEESEEDGREEEAGGRPAPEGSEGDRNGGDSFEAQGRGADTRGQGDDKRGDSRDRGQG